MALLEYLAERTMMKEDYDTFVETEFVNTAFGPMGVNVIRELEVGLKLIPAELIPWELSEYEVQVMGEVVEAFGKLSTQALTEKMGQLCPEWRKPSGEFAEVLEFPVIWRALGFQGQDAEDLENSRQEKEALAASWARSHERTLVKMKAEAKNSGEVVCEGN